MSRTNSPFRYDYVGSFLRPESIKQARAEVKAGAITAAQLRKTEDQAIRELVEKQKAGDNPRLHRHNRKNKRRASPVCRRF